MLTRTLECLAVRALCTRNKLEVFMRVSTWSSSRCNPVLSIDFGDHRNDFNFSVAIPYSKVWSIGQVVAREEHHACGPFGMFSSGTLEGTGVPATGICVQCIGECLPSKYFAGCSCTPVDTR